MLRNVSRRALSGKLIAGTPNVGILASLVAASTADGDSGPGLLYDASIDPANAGKQLWCKVTGYTGTPGALFVFEDGSFTVTGEADGSYAVNYDVLADLTTYGSDSSPVIVGAVAASVPAASDTGEGAGTGVDPLGDAEVPAASGSGTGAATGGAASGGVDGDATVESGTGIGAGSGAGQDASGDATAESGSGSGTGQGYGADANNGSATAFSKILVAPGRRYLLRVKR